MRGRDAVPPSHLKETSTKHPKTKDYIKRTMITMQTLPSQWKNFITEFEFCAVRPRLKNQLAQATFSSEGTTLWVLIPVYNIMQEEWLKNGPVSDLSKGFAMYCGSTTRKVKLGLVRDRDFDNNTAAIFQPQK